MLLMRNRAGAVKAEIPKTLYMGIVRLQATESMTGRMRARVQLYFLTLTARSSSTQLN